MGVEIMIKFGEKYKNDDILPYILKICDSTNNILKIIISQLKIFSFTTLPFTFNILQIITFCP